MTQIRCENSARGCARIPARSIAQAVLVFFPKTHILFQTDMHRIRLVVPHLTRAETHVRCHAWLLQTEGWFELAYVCSRERRMLPNQISKRSGTSEDHWRGVRDERIGILGTGMGPRGGVASDSMFNQKKNKCQIPPPSGDAPCHSMHTQSNQKQRSKRLLASMMMIGTVKDRLRILKSTRQQDLVLRRTLTCCSCTAG